MRVFGKEVKNLKDLNEYMTTLGIAQIGPEHESLRYCTQEELFDMSTHEGVIEAIEFYKKHPDRCVFC